MPAGKLIINPLKYYCTETDDSSLVTLGNDYTCKMVIYQCDGKITCTTYLSNQSNICRKTAFVSQYMILLWIFCLKMDLKKFIEGNKDEWF